MSQIQETLTKYGFEPSTGEIYVILAENGEMAVPQIEQKTTLSRASIYDSLSQLLAGGYLDYRKEGRNAYYKLVHPNKLFGLVEEKKRETEVLGEEMGSAIRTLIGSFNLSNNKPGVRFFEGEEGIKEVWWDSLTSTTEILTYGDLESIAKNFSELNKEYLKERENKKIKKRAITNDSPYNRNFLQNYDHELTETKLLKNFPINFSDTIVQIYDNKISYTVLKNQQLTGLIIQEPAIYNLHKNLFNFMWQSAVNSTELIKPPQLPALPPLNSSQE